MDSAGKHEMQRLKYSRSGLNTGQLIALDLVYKYRFVSRQLLAESLGVKPQNGLYEKLEILVEHGYLGKHFDKRLKLQNIPAAYYITAQGLKALQKYPGHDHISDAVIKASYSNATRSQDFIAHTLDIYKFTNLLKQYYSNLKVFTQRDMVRYSYFPAPMPDAFLSLSTSNPSQPARFFLDLITESVPRSSLHRRAANYCEFFESGGWDVTNSSLPGLLFVSEKGSAEKRLQRNLRSVVSRFDMDDLPIYTTTFAALEHLSVADAIWTSIQEPDETISLTDIVG